MSFSAEEKIRDLEDRFQEIDGLLADREQRLRDAGETVELRDQLKEQTKDLAALVVRALDIGLGDRLTGQQRQELDETVRRFSGQDIVESVANEQAELQKRFRESGGQDAVNRITRQHQEALDAARRVAGPVLLDPHGKRKGKAK